VYVPLVNWYVKQGVISGDVLKSWYVFEQHTIVRTQIKKKTAAILTNTVVMIDDQPKRVVLLIKFSEMDRHFKLSKQLKALG
jgi:hypothetical protein